MGTIGGNICHSDPANDLPATMLALGSTMAATGRGAARSIPAEQFFVDTFQTALRPTEILTEIRIPMPSAKSGSAYMKLEKRAGDFPIVGVAAHLSLDARGACEKAGLGLTAVGPKALKPKAAEAALRGKKLTDSEIQEVGALVARDAEPTSDLRGPAEYKKEMVRVLGIRALQRALGRARGGS